MSKNATKKKTECPITREQFKEKAPRAIPVTINGQSFSAIYKEFSTDSLGFNLNGKMTVEIDGIPCNCQIGLNLTLVGSKELPKK